MRRLKREQILIRKTFHPNLFVDKTVIVWNLTRDEENYGVARRALTGHNHFVQDVVISSDGQFALSASWGKVILLLFLKGFRGRSRFYIRSKKRVDDFK